MHLAWRKFPTSRAAACLPTLPALSPGTAIVTSTTVGYGDVAPITPAGRAIAVVLMTVGIALLSLITAHVASLFAEQDVQDENDELKAELAIMHEKLDLLLENFGSSGTS